MFACELMDNLIQDDKYKIVDGVIFYEGMLYLAHDSTLKEKILKTTHDTPLVGHQRFFKTCKQIRERFSWKGLKDNVLRHVREYMTFEQNKLEHTHTERLLQRLTIPEKKWESISMEFIIGLPEA